MVQRMLHITDLQGSFALESAKGLYVPGGEKVIPIAHQILDEAPRDFYPITQVSYDTHNWFSYFSSMECTDNQFPGIHCEYGQPGWDLAFDPKRIWDRSRVFFTTKETFDFWSNEATTNVRVSNRNIESRNELNRVLESLSGPGSAFLPRGCLRDEFFEAVQWDSQGGQKPFQGNIIVQGVDGDFFAEGLAKQGFYIVNPGTKHMTVMALATKRQIRAYWNMSHATTDPEALEPGTYRNAFMLQNQIGQGTVVDTIGLASNFCNDDAILGYLQHGATVRAIEEGMKGIPLSDEVGKILDRAHTGDIRDVLKLDRYKNYVRSGQLELISVDQVLREFRSFVPR